MNPAADLRRTLLDASLELIAKEGLEKLSMREVARRAGVSHQAPYHYFKDREAILAEIVAEGFVRLQADMTKARDRLADPHARLTAIGKAYVAFALKRPAHFKLMFRSELVPQGHDQADACANSAFDVLVSTVNELSPRGDGGALVLAAWSFAHGLSTLLLEGKLDRFYGKGKRVKAAAADAAFLAFEQLLRSR